MFRAERKANLVMEAVYRKCLNRANGIPLWINGYNNLGLKNQLYLAFNFYSLCSFTLS